jgi:hypothetical protein
MSTNRREFIEHLTATAMLGAVPLSAIRPSEILGAASAPALAAEWDLSWTAKLKGKKHKACFDCVEPESGIGVWRAHMWQEQYKGVLGAKASEIQTILILRHGAAVLALRQDMWDKYDIGTNEKITHPITQQGTPRNPTLFGATDGLPAMVASWNLPNFQSQGGVVLACGAALTFWSAAIAKKDGVSAEEAVQRAFAGVQPGVLVQPSGVFAAVRAQQEGCVYVHAS